MFKFILQFVIMKLLPLSLSLSNCNFRRCGGSCGQRTPKVLTDFMIDPLMYKQSFPLIASVSYYIWSVVTPYMSMSIPDSPVFCSPNLSNINLSGHLIFMTLNSLVPWTSLAVSSTSCYQTHQYCYVR